MSDRRGECLKKMYTDELIFICGQTNPSTFMMNFEKCGNVKNDNDKMMKILNFVDDADKDEFSELYFAGDWATTKKVFIEKYSSSFAINMKRELATKYDGKRNIRSFIEQKLLALSTYTTLPLLNQMEIVLSEMPIEVATLYITNDMMSKPKAVILEFSDCVQDVILSQMN